MTDDELRSQVYDVRFGIELYGGGFMKQLSGAMSYADIHNLRKIHDTWTKEWEQYFKMGESYKDKHK
jgi:hypothetical protein